MTDSTVFRDAENEEEDLKYRNEAAAGGDVSSNVVKRAVQNPHAIDSFVSTRVLSDSIEWDGASEHNSDAEGQRNDEAAPAVVTRAASAATEPVQGAQNILEGQTAETGESASDSAQKVDGTELFPDNDVAVEVAAKEEKQESKARITEISNDFVTDTVVDAVTKSSWGLSKYVCYPVLAPLVPILTPVAHTILLIPLLPVMKIVVLLIWINLYRLCIGQLIIAATSVKHFNKQQLPCPCTANYSSPVGGQIYSHRANRWTAKFIAPFFLYMSRPTFSRRRFLERLERYRTWTCKHPMDLYMSSVNKFYALPSANNPQVIVARAELGVSRFAHTFVRSKLESVSNLLLQRHVLLRTVAKERLSLFGGIFHAVCNLKYGSQAEDAPKPECYMEGRPTVDGSRVVDEVNVRLGANEADDELILAKIGQQVRMSGFKAGTPAWSILLVTMVGSGASRQDMQRKFLFLRVHASLMDGQSVVCLLTEILNELISKASLDKARDATPSATTSHPPLPLRLPLAVEPDPSALNSNIDYRRIHGKVWVRFLAWVKAIYKVPTQIAMLLFAKRNPSIIQLRSQGSQDLLKRKFHGTSISSKVLTFRNSKLNALTAQVQRRLQIRASKISVNELFLSALLENVLELSEGRASEKLGLKRSTAAGRSLFDADETRAGDTTSVLHDQQATERQETTRQVKEEADKEERDKERAINDLKLRFLVSIAPGKDSVAGSQLSNTESSDDDDSPGLKIDVRQTAPPYVLGNFTGFALTTLPVSFAHLLDPQPPLPLPLAPPLMRAKSRLTAALPFLGSKPSETESNAVPSDAGKDGDRPHTPRLAMQHAHVHTRTHTTTQTHVFSEEHRMVREALIQAQAQQLEQTQIRACLRVLLHIMPRAFASSVARRLFFRVPSIYVSFLSAPPNLDFPSRPTQGKITATPVNAGTSTGSQNSGMWNSIAVFVPAPADIGCAVTITRLQRTTTVQVALDERELSTLNPSAALVLDQKIKIVSKLFPLTQLRSSHSAHS